MNSRVSLKMESKAGNLNKTYSIYMVNPWDDADCVKLSMDYLLNVMGGLYMWCYGYNESEMNHFKNTPYIP